MSNNQIPERSRTGMGAALGLLGFDLPRPYVYGEAKAMLVEDLERRRIDDARVRAQQERDARGIP
jgi:hypothetical protein